MSMGSFLFREKEKSYIPTKKIVLYGANKSNGVSLLCQIFASCLKTRGSVSVIELGKAYFYDALGFEKHFLSSGFTDYFDKLRQNEQILNPNSNEFSKIHWICRVSKDNSKLNSAQLFRSLYLSHDNFAIFDCSNVDSDNALALLAEADIPVIVIDPLPSKLIEARDFLEKIRFSMPKAILLVNKMNNGVHKAELSRFLGTKDFLSFSYISEQSIYKAEYNSMLLLDLKELAEIRQKTQDMLSKIC